MRYKNINTNEVLGDTMECPKPDNTTRAYQNNPNGFQLVNPHGGTFYLANQAFKTMEVDVAGFSETNVDTTKPTVQQKLHSAVKHTTDRYRLQCASSKATAMLEYKPGGTATIVRNNAVGRVIAKDSDSIGRWSYVTLGGKDGKKVTFVSAYQPCKGKPKKDGSMTVITQQYAQFLEEKRHNPENVRRHFIRDFKRFVKNCKSRGEELVIQGDFNENIGINSDGLAQLCRQQDLMDPIHYMHGHPQDHFSTYLDGKEIIDYILISKSLLPSVQACGYMPFLERIHGDHRATFIDFNTTMLFGAQDTRLAPLAKRQLRSGNPMSINTYFETKHQYLEDHNFFDKMVQLKTNGSKALAEKLDKQLI